MIRLKETAGCLLLGMFVCSFTPEQKPLDKAKVVASIKTVGNDKVTVCDFSAIKGDEVTLPLSMFTEELQIVKLDNKDEAFVKNGFTSISDNYILVRGEKENPYKLFDKKGNFVATVGNIGQGPGEYQLTYDQQIEESAGRIYIVPWNASNIWAYNLKGDYVSSIPLGMRPPKACCWVNSADSMATVALAPIAGYPAFVFSVKPDGKIINYIKPGEFAFPNKDTYNYEPVCLKNTDAKSCYIFNFFDPKPDTLYHYDTKVNLLRPRFTVEYPGKNAPIHTYTELPRYYVGDVSEKVQVDANSFTTTPPKFYIVDKQSLKGSFCKLENDFMGGLAIWSPIYAFNNGYYVANMYPSELKEALEKVLVSNTSMKKEMRTKLTKLKDSITENDNNYILYAKLKK